MALGKHRLVHRRAISARHRHRRPHPQPRRAPRLASTPASETQAVYGRAEAAREQAETTRLERRRGLSGWSAQGTETYGVTLVTETDELAQAVTELTGGRPTAYVVLRVSENSHDNSNRGLSLRQRIERQGLISRPPTTGEREALETGLDAMGIVAWADYGLTRP